MLLLGHRAGDDDGLAGFQAGPRQVEHLGRLHVGEGPEHLLEFRQVGEAGEPASRPQAGAVGGDLHRVDDFAERGRPGVEMLQPRLLSPSGSRNRCILGMGVLLLGHRASSTVGLRLERCSIPHGNVLAQPGHGMGVLFAALNRSRPSVAAQALGIAEAAFAEACAYANARNAFGRPLIGFQTTQIALADLATRLALTETWLMHVARLVDAGTPDLVTEASILKLSAADLAMDAADRALQLHGGYGYVRGHVVERLFRDAKLTQIWEGTNEIQRLQISRAFKDTGGHGIRW